jgi:carbon-monoxide dehydrogenase iron sulfur subunit
MSILVSEALCSGCRACEAACTVWHEGRFGTSAARIRVTKIEAEGLERPRVCATCADAPCVAACPTAALARDDVTGAIRLDAASCVVCPACQDACPFGVVWLHPVTGLPLICDLCDGRPACVGRCSTGALSAGPNPPPGSEVRRA